jgi:hypothetical protein
MIRLMQVINHMLINLEYTEAEVIEHLKAVQYGDLTFEELLDALNLTSTSKTLDERASQHIKSGKWASALAVTKLRIAG